MSRLDDLIDELCPRGVPHRALGDMGSIVRGKRFVKADMVASGVPCIHYGEIYTKYGVAAHESQSFVSAARARTLRFAQPGDVILASAGETIEDIGKSVAWLGERPIAIHDACYAFSSSLDPTFVSYFFASSGFRGQIRRQISSSKISSISTQNLAKARIPVPPTEVQREVVRILDAFSELKAGLEAELQAELNARRVQRDAYWASALTPSEHWKEATLGAIADVLDGPHATPRKTAEGPWYLSISSLVDGAFDLSKSAHLSDRQYADWTRRVSAQRGDTMFSYETRLGQAAFWDHDDPAAIGRRMGVLRPRTDVVDPRFLTLLYLGPQFQAQIRARTISGATVQRIPIANMAGWAVALPELAEQRRIVGTLDALSALTSDLSEGLPAELTARRKQYEYYRDRLFTFKELGE